MGILDKMFGSSEASSDDDKYVLYLTTAINLTAVDGEQSQSEIDKLFEFFGSLPGMTEARYKKIHDRVTSGDENSVSYIEKMNEDDKLELINFLIELANSDGHFHGEEFAYVLLTGSLMGLDYEKLFNHIAEKYHVDEEEFNVASARLKKSFEKTNLFTS